jgi:hypothetical protein
MQDRLPILSPDPVPVTNPWKCKKTQKKPGAAIAGTGPIPPWDVISSKLRNEKRIKPKNRDQLDVKSSEADQRSHASANLGDRLPKRGRLIYRLAALGTFDDLTDFRTHHFRQNTPLQRVNQSATSGLGAIKRKTDFTLV